MLGNVIGLAKTSIQFMLNKRKAQGLSIQTVILVVLATIILVALVAYLSARFTGFKGEVDAAAGTTLDT
tara:strand:+ start:189 stop:395 length:207 start_codon:yes stop_codon:yes gene_type:complete